MRPSMRLALLIMLLVTGCSTVKGPGEQGLSATRFRAPPSDIRPTMLWFWNGAMTPELVDRQLAAMRAEGISEAIIFPRGDDPELQPVFFSEAWFDLIGHTLAEARRTGMHLWLFNDDYFPSGRAGSLVLRGGQIGERIYRPQPHLRPQKLEALPPRSITGPTTVSLGLETLPVQRGLTVHDGRLHADAEAGGGGGIALLHDGRNWQDYTIESDLRIDRNAIGLIVRATDDESGYLVDFGREGGVHIYRRNSGELHSLAAGNTPEIDPTAVRRVQVRVERDRIAVRVNDQAVVSATDEAWPNGTIGLRSVVNHIAAIDNLRVVALNGTPLYDQTFDNPAALDDFDTTAFTPPAIDPRDIIAVAAVPMREGQPDLEAIIDLTEAFRSGQPWEAPPGEFRLHYYRRTHLDMTGLYNNYLDLMHPEAVAAYLDAIHGEYYRRFPDAFGTVLRGFWDDEPANPAEWGHVAWSDVLPEKLAAHGYTPAQVLPAVFGERDRAGRRRQGAYYRAISDALSTYYCLSGQWADAHGVAMISNPYTDHFLPTKALRWGDTFKNDQWFQVPGGDAVFHQVEPGKRAITPRYPTSSGHQLARERILAENLGAYGWGLTPETARFVNGYMALRGVNLTVLHAYWADASKVIHPPPFQPENTWWEATDGLVDWTGRLMELGLGQARAPTAVLYPQRAAEAWYGTPTAERIDNGLQQTVEALEDVQVDFDLLADSNLDGDPHMRLQATPQDGALHVGPQAYRILVLPPVPTLSLETVQRLSAHVRGGGTVVALGELPIEETYGDDDALRRAVAELFGTDPQHPEPSRQELGAGVAVFVEDGAALRRALVDAAAPAVALEPANLDVRVLRKQRGPDEVFLLMNEGEEAVITTATFPIAGTPELWDPDDGSVRVAPQFKTSGKTTTVPLRLEPYKVLAVVFRKRAPPVNEVPHLVASELPAHDVRHLADGTLAAEVDVERPGTYRLVGAMGEREYVATVAVDDPLEPMVLEGPWQFRFDDGDGEWTECSLGSWTEIDPAYSGSARYRTEFTLSPDDLAEGRRMMLDLGQVRDVAKVEVNGTPIGRILWRPYRLDVTEALVAGDNTLTVQVTNTNANERGTAQPSGLLGPVQLVPRERHEVQLQPR